MNCCNDFGQCTQGRDCPARVTKVTKVGKRVDVSRVQLDCMTPSVRRGVWAHLFKRLAQWAGALAVVAIWMLACAATEPSSTRIDKGLDQHHAQKTKVTT